MPAGAHWTLRYEPTINDRIQSRVDTERLRHDEFVLSVERSRGDYRDPIFLEVQFGEDRDGPYDSAITREIGDNRRVIPAPPEPERPRRSFRELLEDYIATPITRSLFGQSMAAPVRSRLDYVSSGRRTLLVAEIPNEPDHAVLQGFTNQPLDQGQFGDAISHLAAMGLQGSVGMQGFSNQLGMQGRQGSQGAMGVQGPMGHQGTPGWQGVLGQQEEIQVPEWLKPGTWAKSRDSYIEVISIHLEPVLWGPTVKFKFWRKGDSTQSLVLREFLTTFTQCERPGEPTSRYERIIKGI